MVCPHAALALCLLSLVAASVAQDDPLNRADPVTEAVSYYEVMTNLPGKIFSITTNVLLIRVDNFVVDIYLTWQQSTYTQL